MVTIQVSIPNWKRKPQKASDSRGNLRIDKTNVDGALKTSFEQVLYIWYTIILWKKLLSTQKLRSMPYTLSLLRNWTSSFCDAFWHRNTKNLRHYTRYL